MHAMKKAPAGVPSVSRWRRSGSGYPLDGRLRERARDGRTHETPKTSLESARDLPLPARPYIKPARRFPAPPQGSVASHIYYAILTTYRNHRTRCATILATWGTQVPAGHLTFYSDQPDSSLPVVALSNVSTYVDAQDRFTYLIMPHAVERMEALGTNWLAWLDDDTWLWPENLHALLAQHDPTSWVWLGQQCPPLRNKLAFCGGAGFAMSYPLAAAGACVAPACTADALVEIPYDRRMGVCFEQLLGVRVTDRIEFNSQPPQFYATGIGRRDRPKGYGHAATFHYVKTQMMSAVTAEEHYAALWQLTRAAMPPDPLDASHRSRRVRRPQPERHASAAPEPARHTRGVIGRGALASSRDVASPRRGVEMVRANEMRRGAKAEGRGSSAQYASHGVTAEGRRGSWLGPHRGGRARANGRGGSRLGGRAYGRGLAGAGGDMDMRTVHGRPRPLRESLGLPANTSGARRLSREAARSLQR